MNNGPLPDSLPGLALVSTGGTIAGSLVAGTDTWRYESAKRDGQSLLSAVPGALHRAQWSFEQPYNIGSQNLELSHMLLLRATLLRLLDSKDIDGIVVTHGTDTMEDMLYFLHLVLPMERLTKPLVFTGAMLPSDDPLADGPANLSCAVNSVINSIHLQKESRVATREKVPFGLVMQGLYTPAAAVEKKSTAGLDAFDGAWSVQAQGEQSNGCLQSDLSLVALHEAFGQPGLYAGLFEDDTLTMPLFESLEVPVVYCAPGNAAVRQLNDLLGRKPASVVVAAPGHGNIPDACVPALQRLLLDGVSVVRASRVAEGGVVQGGEFHAFDKFRLQGASQENSSGSSQGEYSEAGELSLNKCVIRERLRVLARSLSVNRSDTA